MKKIKICFVSLYSYALFNPAARCPFGGAELRAWLLGSGLAKLPDYEVSFIVFDQGQPRVERFGEVQVYRHPGYRWAAHPPLTERLKRPIKAALGRHAPFSLLGAVALLRHPAIWPKALLWALLQGSAMLARAFQRLRSPSLFVADYEILSGKIGIYRQIDADLYCCFGASNLSAEVAAFCRQAGKKYLLFIAGDGDLSPKYYSGSTEIDRYGSLGHLCYYTLQQADQIIIQTQNQAEALRARFGREAQIIRNPLDLERFARPDAPPEAQKTVLWIGKSSQVKAPDVLLRLAQRFPALPFAMILNKDQPELYQRILAEKPPNVTILERVPIDEIEAYFATSFVLINTSLHEGFPNTFLQAGKYGLPILSLRADPDGFIEGYSCGIVAGGDFERLAEGLRVIHEERPKAQVFSENIHRYVYQNHKLADKISQLDQVVRSLVMKI